MSPTTRSPGRRRSLFALWTLLASWVLLEAVLQIAAVVVKPSVHDTSATVDASALRVVALGDSWVAGAEAPDGQGFVDVFERGLGEVVTDRPVQLFNFGRPGSNSAHLALTAMDELPRIRPEIVIILVGQNNATNFYRVAEVEQRLGEAGSGPRLRDRLRTVKGARIVWANLRGRSGYGAGGRLPEIPEPVLDESGVAVFTADEGASAAARAYYAREVPVEVPTEGLKAPPEAWALLFATIQRNLDAARPLREAVAAKYGWDADDRSPSAPVAKDYAQAISRYALLRWAREKGDWQGVRHHGDALIGATPRGPLVDLGAAEAALLAGDWRTARALLMSAHSRAPGLADVVDFAARFPGAARDLPVDEAMEFPMHGEPTAMDRARALRGIWDSEGARAALAEWVQANPNDLPTRVDLAIATAGPGDLEGAAALMAGVEDGDPTQLLRFEAAMTGENATREGVLEMANRILASPTATSGPGGAALLDVLTDALAEHELCTLLPDAADRWYRARGDATGYTERLAACTPPGEAAERLESLRAGWGPRGDQAAWTALVKAGRKPFEMLHRDLDLALAAAQEVGAEVLLLDYPNPSPDHRILRDVLAEYARTRPVHFLDQWSLFDARFNDATWQSLLGPNGHCNADGYRIMGDALVEFARERGLTAR
jgi:lysophospholipase L1-like esterase